MWAKIRRQLSSDRISYFRTMGISSVLTFSRGLIVAFFLTTNQFGLYVTLVAVALFCSSILSFGLIESFMKSFPRFWAAGKLDVILLNVRKSNKILILRTLIATIIASLVFFYAEIHILYAIFVSIYAASANLYSVYCGVVRATAQLHLLGNATLIRASLGTGCAVAGAWVSGWQGAILGDIFGTLLACLYMRHHLVRLNVGVPAAGEVPDMPTEHRSGGFLVFLALLLVSIPLYLDRAYVSAVYGLQIAGTYGFAMIFGMINSTIVAIAVQSVGPELVRMQYDKSGRRKQINTIVFWSVMTCGLSIFLSVFLYYGLLLWPYGNLIEKYNVSLDILFAIIALSMFRCSEFLDWMLISHNAERLMLFTSGIFFAFVMFILIYTYFYTISITSFIWLLCASRLLQLSGQLFSVYFMSKRSKFSSDTA